MLGFSSDVLMVSFLVLLFWGLGLMLWFNKYPPSLARARDWKAAWGNIHGRLGWVLFFTLQLSIYALWIERDAIDPFQMWMLWGAVLPLLLMTIWAAPEGIFLEETDGLKWFSNGRRLSIHLAKDKKWAVSRKELDTQAKRLLDTIQTTGLPIRISTPLNITPLIRALRKKPNLHVTKGFRWPLAILWLPMVATRRRNRSGLSWWLAVKKSAVSQTWIITPAPASE